MCKYYVPFYIRGLCYCSWIWVSRGCPGTNPPQIVMDNSTIQYLHVSTFKYLPYYFKSYLQIFWVFLAFFSLVHLKIVCNLLNTIDTYFAVLVLRVWAPPYKILFACMCVCKILMHRSLPL